MEVWQQREGNTEDAWGGFQSFILSESRSFNQVLPALQGGRGWMWAADIWITRTILPTILWTHPSPHTSHLCTFARNVLIHPLTCSQLWDTFLHSSNFPPSPASLSTHPCYSHLLFLLYLYTFLYSGSIISVCSYPLTFPSPPLDYELL